MLGMSSLVVNSRVRRHNSWYRGTMTIVSDIEYQADGRTMIGRLAVPDGEGQRPAVLIAHEGPGLDEHQRNRADQLAELGYVAFALDYQGGGVSMTDREAMMARLDQLWHDPARTRELAGAGLKILLDQPRVDPTKVAAIGYCFGGHLVLELARAGTNLAVVVGFHPRLATPRPLDAANITAKVLVCVGTEDPLISVGERLTFEEQMRAAGVDWRMNLYGGAQHSFTHPGVDRIGVPGLLFDPISAERSWRAMLDLFDETFR
jgi:dienelactone hydrolase